MSNRCRVISDQRRSLIWSWSLRRSLSSCTMLFKLAVNLLATTSEQNSSVQNGQSAIENLHQHRPNRFLLYRFQSSQNLLVTVFDLGFGEIWEGGKPYFVWPIRTVLYTVSKITSENLGAVLAKAAQITIDRSHASWCLDIIHLNATNSLAHAQTSTKKCSFRKQTKR